MKKILLPEADRVECRFGDLAVGDLFHRRDDGPRHHWKVTIDGSIPLQFCDEVIPSPTDLPHDEARVVKIGKLVTPTQTARTALSTSIRWPRPIWRSGHCWC